jgi:glutathione synthase/RimK-type ligase-like ATP-grasp enzyme
MVGSSTPPCCARRSSDSPDVRISILSARTGWHTDELLRALTARGHSGCVVPYEALVASLGARERGASLSAQSHQLLDSDAVLARIIPNGSLEQIIYRVDALHWLEDRAIAVMNSPRAIERCVDKFYTSALLHEAGLATPETIVCERIDDAMAAVREMGDVIVFRALDLARAVFYVQRVVEHAGCDVRAFVVGNEIVAAIERRARDGGWRTNISLGGEARSIELPPAWSAIALKAARAVGADYAGVDLLPAQDGTVHVLEVNGIPGWSGVQTTTSTDVAGAIVDHLVAKVTA